MNTTPRGFTITPGFTPSTHPDTLADVKIGDVVRRTHTFRALQFSEPVEVTGLFAVTRVGRDEHGVYLDGESWTEGGDVHVPYANTNVHAVEVVAVADA